MASAGDAPSAVPPTERPPAPVTRYPLPVTGSAITGSFIQDLPVSCSPGHAFYPGGRRPGSAPRTEQDRDRDAVNSLRTGKPGRSALLTVVRASVGQPLRPSC